MAGGSSIAAGPPSVGAPPAGPPAEKDPGRRRRYLVAAGFLLPALVFLGVWVVYPTIYTVIRSFYDARGTSFVGIDNYKALFTTDILLTAIKNNAIWVLVVPALVTAIGLVFAVLTERIRWSVAFKTAVFMPMAISLFAAGVIWHIMYTQDPSQGTLNAAVRVVKDAVNPPGVLSGATPSTNILKGSPAKGFAMAKGVQPGQVAVLGLTGIPPSDVKGGQQAAAPSQQAGAVTGVVWRDFKPGGGKPGKVEQGETGIPGVTLALLDTSGKQVATTTTRADGTFAFPSLSQGTYRVDIAAKTFRQPYAGVPWLGASLITPAIIIAYTWVWAGFAMVVIAAGLASIPRDVLEAARTDGATEWQVFRRVTIPLLAPVLSVVFITMIINVLKVFDIVLSVAPASVQDDANVIALAMWRTAFGGVNDFGLGSAIAVFLFILVIPVLLINVRRFREGGLMATATGHIDAPLARPVDTSPREGVGRSIARALSHAPVNIVLVVIGIAWLIPTLGLLFTSLLPAQLIASRGWWTAITHPGLMTLDNYRGIFSDQAITSALGTTVWIAIGGTVLPIIVAALAGYAFAWMEFPGRDWLFLGVVAMIVVPLQMALIPIFSLYDRLHLFDTIPGLILFHTAFGLPLAIFLLRNFFVGIPGELLEAARIDGASEIRIFTRLVLPLSWPAVASLAIFQFLWTWNDLIVALSLARNTQPITVAIFTQLRQFGANIDVIAPAAFLSLAIPLVVFFAFQRYFVQGLLAGSVK